METGGALLTPKTVYEEVEVETAGGAEAVRIGPSHSASSRSLHERLAGCRRAVVFAATVGAPVEEWTRRLMDSGEMTKGLLADAFGSGAAIALGLAVETVAEHLFKERRLAPTKRYAPGYGDWALADQVPLLSLLDASRIGITLTEDYLMQPAKSISGIIGGRSAGE